MSFINSSCTDIFRSQVKWLAKRRCAAFNQPETTTRCTNTILFGHDTEHAGFKLSPRGRVFLDWVAAVFDAADL